MVVSFDDEKLFEKNNKQAGKDFAWHDFNRVNLILRSATDFTTLPNIKQIDLKSENTNKDIFSVKLNSANRLLLKKETNKHVKLMSINSLKK